ncbi:alanine dehydrogenase [Helicobacter muridarum]|uniref:Alanine dehydrogenase n=1 Tax=Helicobacter muridarum TaxID=216 RepID=A0A099TZ15_9HELI|nr:alanine dehydrogenase [Helicobacter muridarum]TLD98026.1 alanine dehydrogenase [Helicobacter muridarum]STQ85513.1 alanine dehydrogenase [Helicobacter muridarum]
MIIGCPKEIKVHEYRVGLTPSNVHEYVESGHRVLIEHDAGSAIGFSDEEYRRNGAEIVDKTKLFGESEMIIKVKEPIESEYDYFRDGQTLFTYLHLAADRKLTEMLLAKKISSIAYETIKFRGSLPCLAPMSSIAGRLAVIESSKYIQKTFGGSGILLSGIPGTPKGKVTIIGAGVVGLNAAQLAVGIGADVTILDIDTNRLAYVDQMFNMRIHTLYSSRANILSSIASADVVIGAVLIPGAKAPKLVKKDDLRVMRTGAILTDVAIDQGGCFETSNATTHDNPVYDIDGILHYCVANMPGSVARTATLALSDSTLSFGLMIANSGAKEAALKNEGIFEGVNTYNGKCTYKGVSDAFGIEYTPTKQALESA